MDKQQYTLDQLRHLAKIRSSPMDDYLDDYYTSDKGIFKEGTKTFFDWIEEMESKGKISELLNHKLKS